MADEETAAMLFRRFMLLTSVIALMAIAFINIVQATTVPHGDFSVGDRLKQWELFEKEKSCPCVGRTCHDTSHLLNKA